MDDAGPAEVVPSALKRIARVMKEEAAVVAGEEPDTATWLEEIASGILVAASPS